ncbi:MAG: 2-dehydropantoate 2-reductase [Alphaproteobacteria bacterium]|nr:2-dehydropantoate 2-reductase [Alphaproteobacteria bacterium]
MKILMVGAGGVGGYFGGRLAAAGEDVTFIARGPHLAALQARGLRIESPLGLVRLESVEAVETADGLGDFDVVFIAVKLGDTASAIEASRDAVGPGTTVVSLQNGLAADDLLIAAFGVERVVGGVAYIASQVAAPGVIRHTGTNQRIQIGELDGGISPRIDRIAAALGRAGIDVESVGNITYAMWEKFVFLVGLAATTSLTLEPIGVIRADPDMRGFLRAVMAEAAAVGRARGIDFADDYADQRLAFADSLPADMTSSMYHDLVAGKPLELDWLSGSVMRMGRDSGIDTPVNATVYAALKSRRTGNSAGS